MLILYRYNYDIDKTEGILVDDVKGYLCDTLELPWKDNQVDVSCIPEGTYFITYREDQAARIKQGYLVHDVLGRSEIFIHAANYTNQLQGCLAVGIKCMDWVSNSRDSLINLRLKVGDSTELRIKNIKLLGG